MLCLSTTLSLTTTCFHNCPIASNRLAACSGLDWTELPLIPDWLQDELDHHASMNEQQFQRSQSSKELAREYLVIDQWCEGKAWPLARPPVVWAALLVSPLPLLVACRVRLPVACLAAELAQVLLMNSAYS